MGRRNVCGGIVSLEISFTGVTILLGRIHLGTISTYGNSLVLLRKINHIRFVVTSAGYSLNIWSLESINFCVNGF